MARFIYTAKTDPRTTFKGEIEAESQQDAVSKIIQLGYYPIVVNAAHTLEGNVSVSAKKRIAKKELLLFTHQLSRLLESGVNILKSLLIVAGQTPNRYFKAVITDIGNKVKEGRTLSDSLKEYPQLFPVLYTATLLAGETSGTIEKVLKQLAQFLEKEETFKNSIRQSLIYPTFVAVVGVISVAILMGFVVPRLITMFEDMGQALPLPTLILISISKIVQNYWWFLISVVLLIIFAVKRFYHTSQGRHLIDKYKLKIILVGDIVLKTEVSRLMRTLSLLVSSGIPIVSALEVAQSAIGNQLIQKEIRQFKEQITQGVSLSKCMQESKLFPSFVTNIIAVGEEGGSLETSLLSIADEYQDDVDRALKAFTSLLEPVVILIMGLLVGFIVMAMLLPIFQINLIAR